MELRKLFGIADRLKELNKNLWDLKEARLEGKTEIELPIVEFVTPLAILPIAAYANQFDLAVTCTEDPNTDACRYLGTIRFPEGVTYFQTRDKSYLPIAKLPPIESNHVLSEYEDRILSQANVQKNSVKYLTSELVSNVMEHARIDHYWLLAQYYPDSNTCEIVIADNGVGYKKSYEGTKFEVETDVEAIKNALEGRSSKSSKEKSSERGYGIPSIANLFLKGYRGKLIIMSGKSIVYYKQNTTKIIELDSCWEGSVVCINFKVRDVDVYSYLR